MNKLIARLLLPLTPAEPPTIWYGMSVPRLPRFIPRFIRYPLMSWVWERKLKRALRANPNLMGNEPAVWGGAILHAPMYNMTPEQIQKLVDTES